MCSSLVTSSVPVSVEIVVPVHNGRQFLCMCQLKSRFTKYVMLIEVEFLRSLGAREMAH